MRPTPPGTETLVFQATRISDAYLMSSRHRERLPNDLLRLRLQTYECELEQERKRSLTTGWSMPPEWSASLEKECVLLKDQLLQDESALPFHHSLSSVHIEGSSNPISIHAPTPRLPQSAPASISVYHIQPTNDGDTVVYTPTPQGPHSAPASASVHDGVERQRASSPYSIRGRATLPRAATTRPLPQVPVPPPHHRTGSVVNSTSKTVMHAPPEQFSSIHHKKRSATSSLTMPVRSLTASSRPPSRPRTRPFLLPPPMKVADVQATFANGVGENSESPERRHFGDDIPFPSSRPASPSSIADEERATSPVYERPERPASPTLLSPFPLVPDQSGRRSARGWYSATPRPEAKDSLHRFVLSPTRPRPNTTQSERKFDVVDKKEWRIVTEEDDDSVPLVHDVRPTNPTPAVADTSWSYTRGRTPVPARPPAPSFSHSYPLGRYHHRTHLQPEISVALPLLDPTDPDLDDYVVSSASAYRSSAVKITNSASVDIENKISKICISLVGIFRDMTKYKKFLGYRNEAAQRLVDSLQALLDSSLLEEQFRTILLVALLRLSRKSEMYPRCFALTDVMREGDPVSDGHFGEIYKGCFRGRVVCVKAVKMYETSDHVRLHKAFSREAVLWGQLSHPNVLPFYGIYRLGDTRNRIGLISPWMQNGNVNEFLEKNPDTDRRLLITDIAAGMLYLHRNRVVHGDLKGANILVTDSMRACLADFGLSSVTDVHGLKNRDLSSYDVEGGTVRFQAPELIDPNLECPRTEASDVYAFALVCYEIFTGDHPFPDIKHDYTVMLRVGRGERPSRPPGPVYLDRGLTDFVWKLMQDCWKHHPKDRPNAYQVVGRLPPCRGGDQPHHGVWGDLSPSWFNASDGRGDLDRDDSSVVEMLHVLETTGLSLFEV